MIISSDLLFYPRQHVLSAN